MNVYTILIALVILICLVATIVGLFFYCRRIERRCNCCLADTNQPACCDLLSF